MKKVCFMMFLMQVFIILALYGQKKETMQAAEKAAFLAKAPARVQQYYRVFDSLAITPQVEPAHNKWSINELKKYASLVYDANEYDPVQDRENYKINLNAARLQKKGNITNEVHVIGELEKRISKKHALIVGIPYWFTVVVDNIQTIPYNPEIYQNGINENRIRLKIIKVWKGIKYTSSDYAICYYLDIWNYHGLERGKTYLVALYPMSETDNNGDVINSLGGPKTVQQSVYPIEGDYVVDQDNVFGMGNKVETIKFFEAFTSTIKQIKSWGRID